MMWFTWCHTYNYDVVAKILKYQLCITVILAVTMILKLGNNRQV